MMNNRHSIRLKGYDYSNNGKYFITIDTWQKRKIFGDVVDERMILNKYGKILEIEILNTQRIRQGVNIPVFQIMPDHFHMILEISVGAHGNAPVQSGCEISVGAHGNAPVQSGCEISVGAHGNAPVQNLGFIIRGIKMAVTMKMKISGYKSQVWQRNYYEEIIRSEGDFDRIRNYILDNPKNLRS